MIAVVGMGQVGIATAARMHQEHFEVLCVDHDLNIQLRAGRGVTNVPVPVLEELTWASELHRNEHHDNVVIICTGEDQAPEAVQTALDRGYQTIITRSTLTPDHYGPISRIFDRRGPDVRWYHWPEFLRAGSEWEDIRNPFIPTVLGCDYKPVTRVREMVGASRTALVSIREAMMVKLANNAMAAARISVANAFMPLCESVDVNARSVFDRLSASGAHPPVVPGIGFGGSCFEKDLKQVRDMAQARNMFVPYAMFDMAIRVNDELIGKMANQVLEYLTKTLSDREPHEAVPKIVIFGTAFKAGTRDTRNSRGIALKAALRDLDIDIVTVDPMAASDLEHAPRPDHVPKGSLALIMTDDPAWLGFDWKQWPGPVFDGRYHVKDGDNIVRDWSVVDSWQE